MLCEKCCGIHFKRLGECDIILKEPSRFRSTNTVDDLSRCVFYFHHEDQTALKMSADQGCHLCGMLWARLFVERTAGGGSPYYFERGEVILSRFIFESWLEEENGMEEWNRTDWIYINCGNRSAMWSGYKKYHGELRTPPSAGYSSMYKASQWILGVIEAMLGALTGCMDERNQVSSHPVPKRPLTGPVEDDLKAITPLLDPWQNPSMYSPWADTSTMSPASLALASVWFNNCRRNHVLCGEFQGDNSLPRRVVNIEDPNHPFLEDGNNRKEDYVTLSYKWGNCQRYITTSQNLSSHQREIPRRQLPRTFQDAISVAHALGFNLIWIDALCILQDSKEDKDQEISKMDQVFRFSVLTLYAAASNGIDTGLAVERDPRSVKPCSLKLRTTLDGKTVESQSHIILRYVGDNPQPLFDRGWVLQEQVLAPRGLIFGSRRLTWRCLGGDHSESYPDYGRPINSIQDLGTPQGNERRSYPSGVDRFNSLRLWIYQKNPVPDRVRWQRDIHFDHWYSMIEGYNQRALTYSTDVLPALTGLANAIAKRHSCTYISGLWKEDLQVGLTWYLKRKRKYEHVTNSELNLPSWTWATAWGQEIEFRGWENNHVRVEAEGVQLYSRTGDIDTGMSLTLIGGVRMAMVEEISGSRKENPYDLRYAQWPMRVIDAVSSEAVGYIALDSDPVQNPVGLIHCLLCTAREKYFKWDLCCIGLVAVDGSYEVFKRVGLVYIHEETWFGKLYESRILTKTRRPGDNRFTRMVRIV